MNLKWDLKDQPMLNISAAVSSAVTKVAREHMPDLADMFPLQTSPEMMFHFDECWMIFRATERHVQAIPVVGKLKEADVAVAKARIVPFTPRSHFDLYALLGPSWFSFDRFTYVGPFRPNMACWPDVHSHLIDWLNHLVIPEILRRNKQRVLRAIPSPPKFDLEGISKSIWVLESDEYLVQGTAFELSGVGLVTCQHVLRPDTRAFRPDKHNTKLEVFE